MPFRFAAETLAFGDRLGASRLAQALDLAVQIRQTLVNTGRVRLCILLGFGRLYQRLLNFPGAVREVRRRVFRDEVAEPGGENQEIRPLPPNPGIAPFAFLLRLWRRP